MVVPAGSTFVRLTHPSGAQLVGNDSCNQCQLQFQISPIAASNIVLVPPGCTHLYHAQCAMNVNSLPCSCEFHGQLKHTAFTTVAGAVAAPLVIPPLLGMAGFGAVGVGAGTAAATWQASIGNVAARSLFSTCQRIGATGVVPAVGWLIGGGIGAAAGAARGFVDGGGSGSGGNAGGAGGGDRDPGGDDAGDDHPRNDGPSDSGPGGKGPGGSGAGEARDMHLDPDIARLLHQDDPPPPYPGLVAV